MRIGAILRVAAVAAMASLLPTMSNAQDIARANFKVLGSFSNLNMSRSVERPFWTQRIPERSRNQISADFTTIDQMNLQGTEILRLIRLGVIDFGSGNVSYMAGDSPIFDGLDLAGVFLDLPTLRRAVDAYKPVLSRIMAERYNARLLSIWPAPPQVLYCRQALSGLGDLRGRRIRSFSPTIADFIGAIGGTPVQIVFSEVVPSLQRGTADCGVTGTLSGNTARWWEVTTHLYPLVVGWAPWFNAVNLATWNRLPPATQAFMEAQMREMENAFWENAAREAQDGINCNIGQGECVFGVRGSMTLVNVSDADRAQLARVAAETVVPAWAQRCGADCTRTWNETVGRVLGITAAVR